MPELPGVETTRRGIAPHVTGRRVVRIDVYDSRLRWPVPSDLDARMRGRTIMSTSYSTTARCCAITIRGDSERCCIASSKKGHPLLDALGPEPFDPAFDAACLWRTTRARRAAIKLALMDNHVVSDVGNIYA